MPGGSEERVAVAVPPPTRNTAVLDLERVAPAAPCPPPAPLLLTSPSNVSVEMTHVDGRHRFNE